MPARAYSARTGPSRSAATRARILAAVRELLAEGAFHESTMEEVADRAGVARATLYQHFRSRIELVDAICDTLGENPALVALRDTVALEDPGAALDETIAHAVAFWRSEEPVLAQIYGVVAVDPAARDLVDRQRADRRGEMERLARHLRRSGWLREGLTERAVLPLLMLVTSFESFLELREAGVADREIVRTLRGAARALLS